MTKEKSIEVLNAILSYANIGRKEFSIKIGIENPQWIADVLNPKKKVGISKEKAERICAAYPEINYSFVISGDGRMINETINSPQLPTGTYRESDIPERYMTYLVPLAAMGGSLIGFDGEGVRREDCEKVISPIADADWAVPVCGDSMEPEYPNGSRVYVKQVNPGDFIAWGNVFVLDTTNGLIIKVVTQSEREDCVRCVSLNPSGRYLPFDVPMRTIRAMYRVLLCVSVK